jgi:hypothetical protein
MPGRFPVAVNITAAQVPDSPRCRALHRITYVKPRSPIAEPSADALTTTPRSPSALNRLDQDRAHCA